MTRYQHLEAFCLMKYRDAGGHEEIIWNSRDGVTPFVVVSRFYPGAPAQHVDWAADIRVPFYIPKIGERVFVDLTLERALEKAAMKVQINWSWMQNHGKFGNMTQEQAIEHFATAYKPWEPDLVMVDKALRDVFFQRSQLARQVKV